MFRRSVVSIVLAASTVVAASTTAAVLAAPIAAANVPEVTSTTPAVPAPTTSAATIDRITPISDRRVAVFVNSPALRTTVQVQVLLPRNRSVARPTVYMLDGVSAGSEANYAESTWTFRTDTEAFFADKDVNVVLPVGGRGSYYADWLRPDPALGVNTWETFLTSELPPLIDREFDGNGTNTVLGLSMGAQSAVNLVTKHPDLYTGVAGYSGCYSMAPGPDRLAVRAGVLSQGGNADNMFGADDNPAWNANDPSLRVDALRGKAIYLGVGTGLAGPGDTGISALYSVPIGGPLEAAANDCTRRFATLLASRDIPATVNLRPVGTHSWSYWQEDLHQSWPVLAGAMGVPA